MKAGNLIDLFMLYDSDDEIEIEIYETGSGRYVDSTSAVQIVDERKYPAANRMKRKPAAVSRCRT